MAFRWVLAITLLLGSVLSAIIPPGKSPDEADHMVRAYLLSQGHVFLKTERCQGENALCHNGSTMSGGLGDGLGLGSHEDGSSPGGDRKSSSMRRVQGITSRWSTCLRQRPWLWARRWGLPSRTATIWREPSP